MKNNLNLKYKLFRKGVAALAATMVIGSGAGSFNDALANASHEHEYVIDIDNEIENEVRLANASKKEIELKQLEEKKDITISKNVEYLHIARINPINSSIMTVLKNMIATDNNCINKNGHKFSNRTKKVYTENEQNGIHNVIAYKYCLECGKVKIVKTTEECTYILKFEDEDGKHMECSKCGDEKVVEKNSSKPGINGGGAAGGGGGAAGGGGGAAGGGGGSPKPEEDTVVSTVTEYRSNDDGTHKVVKVETYKSGKKVEIVLKEKETCNMGPWTNNGAAGEISVCPDCKYEKTRPHNLSGTTQDNYTYTGKDANGNYTHRKTSAEACANGCGYVDEKNPIDENCTYASDATVNADGITVQNTCQYCHEIEDIHIHKLKSEYNKKDTGSTDKDGNPIYDENCGLKITKCTDPNCKYDKDGNYGSPYIKEEEVPHAWKRTNREPQEILGTVYGEYACEHCGQIKFDKVLDQETANQEIEQIGANAIEGVSLSLEPKNDNSIVKPETIDETTLSDIPQVIVEIPKISQDTEPTDYIPKITNPVDAIEDTKPDDYIPEIADPVETVEDTEPTDYINSEMSSQVEVSEELNIEEPETNELEEESTILSALRRYKEYLLNALNVDNNKNKTKTKVLK